MTRWVDIKKQNSISKPTFGEVRECLQATGLGLSIPTPHLEDCISGKSVLLATGDGGQDSLSLPTQGQSWPW